MDDLRCRCEVLVVRCHFFICFAWIAGGRPLTFVTPPPATATVDSRVGRATSPLTVNVMREALTVMPRPHPPEVSRSLPAALQVMASRILRSACQIAAVLLATLLAPSVSAQTTEATAATIEGLHQALDLMVSADAFFRSHSGKGPGPGVYYDNNYVPPTEQELADSYAKMTRAANLFSRFAGEQSVAQALNVLASLVVFGERFHPSTLQEAVAECERRGVDFSSVVTQALGCSFFVSWDRLVAKTKYGSIKDNPAFYGVVAPPTSALDLLRNAKWAIDHDVVLRVDFFTPENMNRFFGTGNPVFSLLMNAVYMRSEIKAVGSDVTVLGARPDATCAYGASGLDLSDGGFVSGRLYTSFRSGRLYFECDYYPNNAPTFDEVVRVFGDKWKDHGPLPPARARSWPPAAAPHGNGSLTYVFDDALRLGRQVHGKLEVDFAPDARVTKFDLYVDVQDR